MTLVGAISTPWYRRRAPHPGSGPDCAGSTAATGILDLRSSAVADLVRDARESAATAATIDVLARAHSLIRDRVRPVYALDEATPTSRTLARGTGSCSQRLAILEAVARSLGTPTRVRALLIDRSFWYPRFPRLRFVLPDPILLVWPEFLLDDGWRGASELFGALGCGTGGRFENSGSETLFEAVGRCAIDWDGRTTGGDADLSSFVRTDAGYFTDRDTTFAALGQTLSTPFRLALDPILRRVSA